jgi:poly-gamma-glutamate synthesis protein (capsule biosynthesis protein)
MQLDGTSVLDSDFTTENYPLLVSIGAIGEEEALASFLSAWRMPATNRDPSKLTHVAMTGVTALVRATATQMEADGILTPAVDVGPVLREADITHISNEVSFAEDCPEPNPIGGTIFCSQDDYFALLEDLGTDVIELTGNHLNDWGPDAVQHTLDMYDSANMVYFGGGRNQQEAAQPALFEHNGNRIAFVGCNPVGPNYAWAGSSTPGSQACSPDFQDQIRNLTEQGYLVIATQQYYEFYHYPPTSQQQEDFKELVDSGAAAVSGSQGHHVQAFDFHNGAFIHYGLGNLFFDQMDMLGTRQSFVDIYTFYDGRLLNVELWTGLIEDFFQPRLMTSAERQEALQALFQASGW